MAAHPTITGLLRRLPVEPLLFVLVVAALGFGAVDLPADGDAAMGLLPASIWLAGHGFDLPGLLAQPGFWDGGPNNYAISPVTWLVALVIALTGGAPVTLIVLRLLQFAAAAWALTGFRRLAAAPLGRPASWLLALAVLLFPLFRVQTQTIYFEIPLFLCAVGAARAWLAGKPVGAAAWAFLAAMIKPSGVIVAGALALLALAERRGLRSRLLGALMQLGPALVPAIAEMVVKQAPGQSLFPDNPGFRAYLTDHLFRFMRFVPDVAAIVVAAAIAALFRWRSWSSAPGGPSVTRLCDALVTVYIAFFLLAPPLSGYLVYVLPRYFVLVLPFALLSLGVALRRGLGRKPLVAALALFAVSQAINAHGRLYPATVDNEYSVAERSLEYRDVVALRRQVLRFAVDNAHGKPVIVSLFDWFHLRHPLLGYVDEPPPRVLCHAVDPVLRTSGADAWPDELVLVRSFDGNRAAAVDARLQQLVRQDPRRLRGREFRRGRFGMVVIEVRRPPAP